MKKTDFSILETINFHCNEVNIVIQTCKNSFNIFSRNLIYKNSMSMSILQIGELANSLSTDFKEQTTEQIPWRNIINMRNRFAHGYLSMDMEIVWNTAINDIPKLQTFCNEILNKNLNQSPNNIDGPSSPRF
jgi:uncharacterized protein with HEPN domain